MLALFALLAANAAVVEHDAAVSVDVAAHTITVTDRIRGAGQRVRLLVPPGATVTVAGAPVSNDDGRVDVDVKDSATAVVTMTATIHTPPVQAKGESQRSFQDTSGTIDAAGVYLSPASRWLPVVVDGDDRPALVTGQVSVTGLPSGWSALCEGKELARSKAGGQPQRQVWREDKALDGLHLIAGPFVVTREQKRGVDVQIWLRTDNGKPAADADALSDRYLEVTGQYLEQYEALIGKYPYAKFALVENFWETGYGMPSFTLLGPQVIRFPFILHTSWPHELLHNWWGNGVFVGAGGNWSEGLTSYLADHLNAEQNGRGAEYRRTALARYLDFVDVDAAKDFPLRAFGSRDSAESEAVGYGKTMMVFHMVRRLIGDDAFARGLQRLWRERAQQRASFDDVAAAFSAESGRDLAPFFTAWTTQTGIPRLTLREVGEEKTARGERFVHVVVEEAGGGAFFPVPVPVVVTTVDGRIVQTTVEVMSPQTRSGHARVQVPAAVARVDVDPFFDVFRRPAAGEIPTSLSRSFGAHKMLFVTPSLYASAAEKDAWAHFANGFCAPLNEGKAGNCRVVDDRAVGTLPDDAAVFVLGYGNFLRGGAYVFTKPHGVRFDDHGFFPPGAWDRVKAVKGDVAARLAAVKEASVATDKNAVAVVVDHPRNPRLAMTFIGAHSPDVIPLLAKKLPHYGKYSYLAFAGAAAENSLKGTWSASASGSTANSVVFRPGEFKAKEPKALIALPPPFDAARMQGLVRELADEKRGRGDAGEFARSRAAITAALKKQGISDVSVECDEADKSVCNLIARLPGTDPALPRVVLGAHYDHLPATDKGKTFFPGADDNASGVAVAVEVAAFVKKAGGARGVDVVFFDAEERGRLGSISYLKKVGAANIHSVVNLDTVGRLPPGKPFLVLDGNSASEWVHIARGVGFTTGVAVELAPQGGGASDQATFTAAGIPAIQLFSGPNPDYHQPTDTADKVLDASLVKAAVVTREMVAYLRDRKEPLSAQTSPSSTSTSGAPRRASLGSVPDMTFAGPGVRFEDVVAGSAAAKAGLQRGDVLVRFDGAAVADLKGYSDLLKQKAPGDRVRVVVVRGGEEVSVDVELGAR